MMKLIVLAAFVSVAVAGPRILLRVARSPVPLSEKELAILRQASELSPEGSYEWSYETENGISAQEQASVKAVGPEEVSKDVKGSFSWTSPEGEPIAISYVADENGYQPTGDSIPVPPPVPSDIARSLAWIAAHPEPAEGVKRFR